MPRKTGFAKDLCREPGLKLNTSDGEKFLMKPANNLATDSAGFFLTLQRTRNKCTRRRNSALRRDLSRVRFVLACGSTRRQRLSTSQLARVQETAIDSRYDLTTDESCMQFTRSSTAQNNIHPERFLRAAVDREFISQRQLPKRLSWQS